MARNRWHRGSALDDLLNHARDRPAVVPPLIRNQLVGDLLHDRDGLVWTVDRPWLEPDEVTAQLRTGADWVIELCWGAVARGQQLRWADEHEPAAIERVLAELITAEKAQRLRRKRRNPTVTVAALMRSGIGHGRLVLFSETGPHPRF